MQKRLPLPETRRLAGTWDLKFEMNYDDTTIDLPAASPLTTTV
ncbi:MAG: hypothetical protein ACLT98_12525 [Eggerthellaceae bacterium]